VKVVFSGFYVGNWAVQRGLVAPDQALSRFEMDVKGGPFFR
jgi:hypothetical protein